MSSTLTESKAPVDNSGMSVQEAAERTGLSAHTLRYYERAGLLPRIGRTGSGEHRRYSERDLGLIVFLKRLRATGMPICRLREYVALVQIGDTTLDERREMLTEQGEQVKAQIAELQASLAVIEWKIEHYRCLCLSQQEQSDDEKLPDVK